MIGMETIQGTVLLSITCNTEISVDVVSFIIICHQYGVPGRSLQDPGGRREKRVGKR